MSLDLADLKRLKITEETRAWLSAEAQRTGRSQQEVARDALHEIALSKIKAARLLVALAPDEGRAGDTRGQGPRR
jgi:hypothetical protein